MTQSQPRPGSRYWWVAVVLVPLAIALLSSPFWSGFFTDSNSPDSSPSSASPVSAASSSASALCQINASEISLERSSIEVTESIKASIRVDNPEGRAPRLDWRAVHGRMNPGLQAASTESTYTAPSQPVDETISVEVTLAGCEPIRRSIQLVVRPASQAAAPSPVAEVSPTSVSSTPTIVTTPTPVPTLVGAMWRGEYFNNEELTGPPRFEQVSEAINFVWDGQSPGTGLSFEHWSARWTAEHCFKNGPVSFYMKYDDGLKLIVDGEVVYDDLSGSAQQQELWKTHIVSGCTTIIVEYRQATGGSSVKFGWQQP